MSDDQLLTVPMVAKKLGVKAERVSAFIRAGELKAFNLGQGSKKPRFKVAPDDLQRFLEARAVRPAAKPVPRIRRRPPMGNVPSRY